ncbi:MAG: sigma-70 family RNA polymerase sigma factor [Ignavibacteria bacterium]|nr:MAG: sigma-70 family RNA polymerase sigma factor [Ignavibacteria bacterium]
MPENPDIMNKNIADEDFEIIKRFQNGDESAFRDLVMKHKDKVRNLVYLTLGDNDFIDDISQDVFISTYKKLNDFRFESKFTTWLYRVTVNKCRDYLRKKKVRSIFTPLNEDIHQHSSRMRSENMDIPGFVRKAIERLPEKLKEPLILRDIEGFSYKEIAEKLDVEVGTIKSRIFRARESLKIILEPMQKELGY